MKRLIVPFALLIIIVTAIGAWQGFLFRKKPSMPTSGIEVQEEAESERTDDLAKALEEEEALLRDPRTGKIPRGIREVELAQAGDILRTQLVNNQARTQASTYFYQGPNNLGGRTRSVAFDVSSGTSAIMLAGSVSGGVFKTTNSGSSWTRVSPANQNFTVTTISTLR